MKNLNRDGLHHRRKNFVCVRVCVKQRESACVCERERESACVGDGELKESVRVSAVM